MTERDRRRSAVVSPADVLRKIPGAAGERFAPAFRHGTLEVELYAPRGVDSQTPHRRDEAYVVVRGRGTFVHGGERTPFAAGDFLFVAAGVEHRFEAFDDDLVVWVLHTEPGSGGAFHRTKRSSRTCSIRSRHSSGSFSAAQSSASCLETISPCSRV